MKKISIVTEGRYDLKRIKKAMKKVQTGKRFEHTLGVEYTAAALAMRYDTDILAARVAGLLHDCAKCIGDTKTLNICSRYEIPINEMEQRNPFLLHAKVGAFWAEHKYGVTDMDICNAIRNHTTGRENMSTLEKIIFVADYIEPGRKQAPNLSEIRNLAFTDLDSALCRILQDTLSYLKESDGEIDPQTEATLKFYEKRQED